jgi:dTDP-4-dehydrorhamnose 3,5-epimerase
MQLRIEHTHLNGIVVLVSETFQDDRGFFLESFRADQFSEIGLPHEFLQDNHSGSVRNVVRGLHFQYDPPMGKLMRVTRGTAFLVAVDIRPDSPTLGQWVGLEVSAESRRQVWAPAGFARGFCVLSEFAEVQYKCTAIYTPATEVSLLWNDPDIGVAWPVTNPLLSKRDRQGVSLKEWLRRDEARLLRTTVPSRTT